MRTVSSDVVFVTMPFAMPEHPALGLSLLKASLTRAGIQSHIEYLNLQFVNDLDFENYAAICKTAETDLVGEWVFSAALFPAQDAAGGKTYFDRVIAPRGIEFAGQVTQARARAESFLRSAAQRVLAHNPKIVGFSSVFAQHVSSLALARRLKDADPSLTIVFGGANCEATMGAALLRSFDWVDAVVSGEADAIIADLVRRILAKAPIDDMRGVYTMANLHAGQSLGYPSVAGVRDLDSLPDPDFDDFFAQVATTADRAPFEPRLLFETARGCWWGEKHHCTFCGLNGTTMAFRSKSPQRALDELQRIVGKHNTRSIGVVDNILDMTYLKTFIPQLAERNLDLDLLYEVKANLKKDHLRALKAAGVNRIQPGIESLNTEILNLMRKGVRGLQNVQLLKWCRQLGIGVSWNLLWGFPGERAGAYAEMDTLVQKLTHLEPPGAHGAIRLDRFSPNFIEAQARGLVNVRPYPAYADVFDLSDSARGDLAYYFTFDYAVEQDVRGYTRGLSEAIESWRTKHAKSELVAFDYPAMLLVGDWRDGSEPRSRILQGVDRVLYRKCDEITSLHALVEVATACGEPLSARDVEGRLKPLLDANLMLREGDAYLALALPADEYVADKDVLLSLRSMAMMLLAA